MKHPEYSWNVYLPLIADVDAQVLSMPRFGQKNTMAGLEGTSIQRADFGPELMRAYFKHFVESGKLQRPPDARGKSALETTAE